MAKSNQRDPNLRAATVARVNQLLKGGLTKAGAFEKISSETGRAKDAVQMLYYRAVRAGAGSKPSGKGAPKGAAAAKPVVAAPTIPTASAAPGAAAAKPARRRRSRKGSRPAAAPRAQSVVQTGDFPALLNGIAVAINNLLKHVEKTVEDNTKLREQADRLKAITSLIRGR